AFGDRVRTAVQEKQLGTGDATRAGMSLVTEAEGRVLVFCGDVPLVEGPDLAAVLRALEGTRVAMATCTLDDVAGYGRIIRDASGALVAVREQKDLKNDAERAIREMNPGIFACDVAYLRESLASLQPNNAQGEYYLTDIVSYAVAKGIRVASTS